jgi:hypothetical protein
MQPYNMVYNMVRLSDESIEKISTQVANKVCYKFGQTILMASCLGITLSVVLFGVATVVKRYEERQFKQRSDVI